MTKEKTPPDWEEAFYVMQKNYLKYHRLANNYKDALESIVKTLGLFEYDKDDVTEAYRIACKVLKNDN